VSRCTLDHITVTSPSLGLGAEFVRQTLGVEMQAGGEHVRMGTHNLLLRLGDAMLLEVIAPNPNAPRPARPRWFGLDKLAPGSMPALTTWVARAKDIRAAHASSSEPLGTVEPMRRGDIDWLITIPADGSVPLDGIAPALIQWQTDIPPAATLQDLGLELIRLDLVHPDPDRVSRLLASIGFEGPVSVSETASGVAPHLRAQIRTPNGPRELSIAAQRK